MFGMEKVKGGRDIDRPPEEWVRREASDSDGFEGQDFRFRELMSEAEWNALPAPVRKRFSKQLEPGAWAVYRGHVVYTTFSWAGIVLAQMCRLIGGPLPLSRAGGMPALVAVCGKRDGGGQIWTRIYGRPGRFHQVIHSEKRFAGPTGLEEYVGAGVGMALSLHVEDQALVFRSKHYFFEAFGRRWRLPSWMSPGDMEIVHREEEFGGFSFTLSVTHPATGRLVKQLAYFKEDQ